MMMSLNAILKGLTILMLSLVSSESYGVVTNKPFRPDHIYYTPPPRSQYKPEQPQQLPSTSIAPPPILPLKHELEREQIPTSPPQSFIFRTPQNNEVLQSLQQLQRKQFPPINYNDSVIGFSWKLFQGSKLADSLGNLVLSPIIIQFLLAILENGADGETKTQLKNVVGHTNAEYIRNVLKSESSSRTAELSFAAGIFLDSSNHLNQTFENTVKQAGAEIIPLPFSYPNDAKNYINSWASKATHGLITNLLSQAYRIENTQIILTSAIYFHSTWKYKFDRIGPLLFQQNTPGKGIQAEFMKVKQNFVFKTIDLGNEYQGSVVEIPYEGDDYSMVIILPDHNVTLDTFIRQLDISTFDNILKMLSNNNPRLLTLKMPIFRVKSHFSVVNSLLKMGLVNLFTIYSRLPYIGLNDDQRISDIIQQAVIDVNENGTVAAATAGAFLVPLSAHQEELIVSVDRPFLCVILDKKNHIPLFISKVYSP